MRIITKLAWITACLTLFTCGVLAGYAYLCYSPAANFSLECAVEGADWSLGADLTLDRFGRVITQRLYPPQDMPPLSGLSHTQALERLRARARDAAYAAGRTDTALRLYYTVGAADAALTRRLASDAEAAAAPAQGAAVSMGLVHAARQRGVSPARLYLAAGQASFRSGPGGKDEHLRHALTLPLDELLRGSAPATLGGYDYA